jgi:hypothetical protein
MRVLLWFFLITGLLAAQPTGQTGAALAAGSYFPLDVGNRWVFRADNRFATGSYETWRVDRTEEINGKQYSVFNIQTSSGVVGESRFRADEQGRVFVLVGGNEQLFLDPRPGGDPGQLRITGPAGVYRSNIGPIADTITYSNPVNGLTLETGQLGRGIGLLWSKQTLQTGSSGGFVEGRDLVEAVVGGGNIKFTAGEAGMHVSMESLTLDVTGQKVTNCVLPCYFAACGLGGGIPDPPGTYKPCARARVALENWPTDAGRTGRLRFVGPDATVLFDKPFAMQAVPGEATLTMQVPLYSAPNQPFPPGAYQLQATTDDGSGQSAITVRIR